MVLTVLSDPLRYMFEQVKLANVFEILLGKRTGTNNTVYCTLQDVFFRWSLHALYQGIRLLNPVVACIMKKHRSSWIERPAIQPLFSSF